MIILPKPGDVVLHDFRIASPSRKQENVTSVALVQWNIERGYKLKDIIAELRVLDADVISLQEIDIGCARSGGLDTGVEIAKALGMAYAFVCEFEELASPLRDAATQGGGVHGNGILSKFDIVDARKVEHTCHPVDWEDPTNRLARKEPRKGRRLTLAATVMTHQGPLLVYSAHLEVFCGMLARIHQLSDIFRDARSCSAATPCQVLMGDLNTVGHGIARLSWDVCQDVMRWRNLGLTEGEVWERHILSCVDHPTCQALAAEGGAASELGSSHLEAGASNAASTPNSQVNEWLLQLGMPLQVCQDIVNPGFSDPWDASKDFTLDNAKYKVFGVSLMTGKLDWILLRGCNVIRQHIGNHDYSSSDHKWLAVSVDLHSARTLA